MIQDKHECKQRHRWHNHVHPAYSIHGDILNIKIREGRNIMVQHIVKGERRPSCVLKNVNSLYVDSNTSQVPVKCNQCVSENIVIDKIVKSSEIHEVETSPIVSGTSPTRNVIFFIHGVGGSSKLWQHQIEYFYQGDYEIVVPDLLGHGLSSAPRPRKAYTFTEIANDVLALFDKFAKEKNILVGHSYGCSFCTKVACERSNQVSKLILISGGGPQSLEPQPCQIFCLPVWILSCIKPIIVNGFTKRAFKDPKKQSQSDKDNSFNAPVNILHAMMKGQDWAEGNKSYHAEINTPVLLIYGMQDQFISLYEEDEMVKTIPNCKLETVEAGHMVMLEEPDKVNDLIKDFIDNNLFEWSEVETPPDAYTPVKLSNTTSNSTFQ
ncbi:protein ABHD8-like [Anneissia japonica]|uniref:protein ABHD8-like n=1 Tax=Anneissia japonica TaxID=1529436 RepID=UPI001425B71E|nr:protein ABHD8-like [Anneissia japonica]XP_033118431.1 protein ABHD8-like [Anneissia japonica]XP_033118438.1 protein ABHD8-like [Anneissia japonica]XP_033118445.1 protein ABHD8-like [Anneissia japonica]